MTGTVCFRGDGPGEEVHAHQRFVDNEPYRAARRGRLIVDKFASRRRFEGWGAWAQDRIRVRGSSLNRKAFNCVSQTRELLKTGPRLWKQLHSNCCR